MDPGRRIGRYTILGPIASGGMAAVHYGRAEGAAGFGRIVAIKGVHPALRADRELGAMLIDEARLASRIRHPNVVTLLDVIGEESELFVVMEYVHGESLAALLEAARSAKREPGQSEAELLTAEASRSASSPVPVAVAAAIASGILRGLHAAHEAKDARGEPLELVHRDVSPQNVLVDVHGVAKICDFGVAKARHRLQVTAQGNAKGKAPYMAPEQVHGTSSRRSDVFSTGIVLWEMLVGERLFEGRDNGAILAKVLSHRIERPDKRRAEVPSSLADVVMRALDRKPERRFETAEAMAEAIEEAATLASPAELGAWTRSLRGDVLDARERLVASFERPLPSVAPCRRRPLVFAAAAIAIAILAAVLSWQSTTPRAPTPKPVLAAAASSWSSIEAAPEEIVPAPPLAPAPLASRSSTPAARPPPRSAPKNDCSPPYEFASGRKIYKRACFE